MIIALLVVMFIMLVVIAKLIKENKEIVEALEYVADCNFRDDLRLDKAIATNKYTHEHLDGVEGEIEKLEVRIYELETYKTNDTSIPKTCSIDGKCNYMNKFTTVK